MKNLRILPIIFFLVLGSHFSADAQSCTSLFSRLTNAFDTMVRGYVDFRSEAAEFVVGTIIPYSDLDDLTEDMKQLQIDAYESVGEVVGDKGTPGPVNLIVPTYNFTGKLYTNRTIYVSNSGWDRVYVSVKKTGGKNGVDIAVCKYDTDGNYINSKRESIGKGNETEGQKEVIEYKAMANDKYLTINLVATGLVSNKCDYILEITGEFNTDKLKGEKKSTTPVLQQTYQQQTGTVNQGAFQQKKGGGIKKR